MTSSENIKKIFGKNVKTLRNIKNITQDKLAESLNMQSQSITFIETGRTFVSSDVLANLCNYFCVEPSYFFKSGNIEPTEKQLNIKKEIYNLLSGFDEKQLQSIYDIIIALKK